MTKFKFLSADELQETTSKGTVVSIHGLVDAGKSTFLVSVAKHMKVLYIDTEGKYGKICKYVEGYEDFKHNLFGIEARTFKDLNEIVSSEDILQFDAIIIDSVTSAMDLQGHDIMFVQKRKRSFDDYQSLGTEFFAILEQLKGRGISVFMSLQSKNTNGFFEPDADGNLVQKSAQRYSDWMFFIEKTGGQRILSLKNNDNALTKSKGIPDSFADQLIGEDVNFSSLWEIFPSKKTEAKKVSAKKAKEMEALYIASNEKKKIDQVAMFRHLGIPKKKFSEFYSYEADKLISLLQQR